MHHKTKGIYLYVEGDSMPSPSPFQPLTTNAPEPTASSAVILEEAAVDPAAALTNSSFDARSSTALLNSLAVVLCAGVGVGLGICLSKLHASADVLAWVNLPGALFVRALRCLVVPLVFCSMTVSIAEVILLQKTNVLSWRTAGVFFATSFSATLQGMLVALVFRSVFVPGDVGGTVVTPASSSEPLIALNCSNGRFLQPLFNGLLACVAANASVAAAQFQLVDVHHALTSSAGASSLQSLSLSDQVIAIVNVMVTDNIFNALANGSLLSIIVFALPLGVAVAKADGESVLLPLLRQIRNALLLLINAVLRATPVAVLFLVASAIVDYGTNAGHFAAGIGYLVLAFLCGVVCHVCVALPLLLFVCTRIQPFAYLRQLLPAYVFAFGCASSMVTLPVAATVVYQTRHVSPGFAQLVLSLGTPTNTNAAGLYYPLMTIFLATMAREALSVPQLVVLLCVSWLGSVSTAPVPNAALVMLMTVWKTVVPSTPLPPAFVYVVAVDFLLDRICTVVNVNGNMVATRILAAKYETQDTRNE
ncbi:hypothetical protein SDRG_09336 [Saprolegnia diclina VS20]|uniref:Amino acid transporter n=1 Tax=Saprolegnia diclina (strain VS20) TaxID=1156394 RepID=T0RRM7_SAPDV|nr:hypothetical protein SDRG_09336 [Saprolegnia diclina VS20]EQC32797.1 hypothetical protein SDRG_09336 [Saprolegnia diclina VS20]|eukprot:XP_008613483.1 hypothetical protein SDRG_09336 [Saprolegnia diclina VS20]